MFYKKNLINLYSAIYLINHFTNFFLRRKWNGAWLGSIQLLSSHLGWSGGSPKCEGTRAEGKGRAHINANTRMQFFLIEHLVPELLGISTLREESVCGKNFCGFCGFWKICKSLFPQKVRSIVNRKSFFPQSVLVSPNRKSLFP